MGGGAHACGRPQPTRIRRAASGSAVDLPQRAVSTDNTTLPEVQPTVCRVPAWPAGSESSECTCVVQATKTDPPCTAWSAAAA